MKPLVRGDDRSLESTTQILRDCPRFDRCSANICPVDPEWPMRSYIKGEAVCFFVLEAVKPGAQARFLGSTAEELYRVACKITPKLLSRYAPMRRPLARARKTPSRLGKRPGTRSRRAAA